MITQEEVKDLFYYNKGKLFWKKSKACNKIKSGTEAGCTNSGGYRQIKVNYKSYCTHRLIFLLFNGHLPEIIDHINGNKLDNRIENLREVTPQENAFNSKISKSNTSGIKGVTWCKGRNKYKSQVQKDGKTHFLGYYDDILAAENKVKEHREQLHGEFSRHD